MENYYDSHCHLFTQKETINLRCIIEIILSLPDILEKEKMLNANNPQDIKDKIASLKRILNFIKVGFSDSEETIYELMQKVYDHKLNLAPLMFDLECCFYSSHSDDKKMLAMDDIHTLQKQLEEIITSFNTVNDKFIKDVKNFNIKKQNNELADGTRLDLQELYKLQTELSGILNDLKVSGCDKQTFSEVLISSYEIQLEGISQLKTNHTDNVFPFIAIDPRRQGIINRFINEIYPKNIFCGVKLYTPNGYSPSDDDLMKPDGLYDFCCKHNIPITAHNSHAGFASPLKKIEIFGDIYVDNSLLKVHSDVQFKQAFTDGWVQDRAEKLNHPDIWDKVVLKKYPNLKLNLAHFGNGSKAWQSKVYAMLLKYPYVYTDLACWTEKADLIDFRNKYFLSTEGERFRSKILYGSDYYLNLLYINSFQEYYDNFMSVFTPDEFTQIALTNAKRFLFG